MDGLVLWMDGKAGAPAAKVTVADKVAKPFVKKMSEINSYFMAVSSLTSAKVPSSWLK